MVEAAGGKSSGLSGEETLHTDRRWCQTVKRSVPHGRSEEAPAGIREFFKTTIHFRSHVWCGRNTHRPQGREVLCAFTDEYPGWSAGCIIMGWLRYFSRQPCSADGPAQLRCGEGDRNSLPAAGQVFSFCAGIEGTESAQ